MTTVSYDKEFEVPKREILQQGLHALVIQNPEKEISKENLGLFLYTKDLDTLKQDYQIPWMEFQGEADEDLVQEIAEIHRDTILWLANSGHRVLNNRYPHIDVITYLRNFQEFWQLWISETEGSIDSKYYSPDMLQWALYLTVRGTIPKEFPKYSLYYTYAIKRWSDFRDRALDRLHSQVAILGIDQNSPQVAALHRKFLEKTIHTAGTTARRKKAKVEGTYQKVPRGFSKDQKKRFALIERLIQEGMSIEEAFAQVARS